MLSVSVPDLAAARRDRQQRQRCQHDSFHSSSICRSRASRVDAGDAHGLLARRSAPRTMATSPRGRPSARATSATSASLAAPSTGGAVSCTLSRSPCTGPSRSREARGTTCTSKVMAPSLSSIAKRHHFFTRMLGERAELAAALGRGLDGVDERRAQAARFERVQPGDRGAARRGHHVLERARVLVGLEQQLGRAEHGLRRERLRVVARQPDLDAGVGERLDDEEDVGRPRARQAGDRVELRLVEHDRHADRVEDARAVARGRSSVACCPAAIAVAPAPTSAGVFGIVRTTRVPSAAGARSMARGRHAGGDRDDERAAA